MHRDGRSRAVLGWALAALAVVLGPAAADAGLTLRLEPVQSTVAVGQEATVNVIVESATATDISGFTVRLQTTGGGYTGGTYPGAPGQATTDYLFPSNTGVFFAANPFDAGNNLSTFPSVKVVLADISEDGAGFDVLPANTPKKLGIVTFAASAPGVYTLNFDDSDTAFLRIADPNDHPIDIDGTFSTTITVTGAAVPAPPAAGLLVLGAACVPLARRLGLRR